MAREREIFGLRFEDEELTAYGPLLLMMAAKFAAWRRKSIVYGELPKSGPGIIIANHESSLDGPILFEAVWRKVGRILHPVVKSTLLHPGMEEDEKVLSRTGKQDDLNTGKKDFKSYMRAWAVRGVGAIEIDRSGTKLQTFKQISRRLRAGQLVGISLYETRGPIGDLRAAQRAAALVVRANPDVPVFLVGLIGTNTKGKVTVQIDKPITYTQLLNEINVGAEIKRKHLDAEALTHIIATLMADLLPDELKREWNINPTLLSA